jgi:hypothetical protein
MDPPFETVTCPYCAAPAIAAFPPARGWPRTASSVCNHCAAKFVVERMESGRFRARRHRGVFEGFLRL